MKLVVVLATLLARGLSQSCDPRKCELPNCRCFNNPDAPGELSVTEIPQMIVVTFQNGMNDASIATYLPLFELVNPNGCAAHGTFFVQNEFTDYAAVRDLYDQGHEIGVNLLDGSIPSGSSDWKAQIKKVVDSLVGVGIPRKDIRGVRAPRLSTGGNDQFIGMAYNGLVYDASCANVTMSKKATLVWPFSLDYKGPSCNIGIGNPTRSFPDKWEIMVGDLEWKGQPCAVPSACPNITTKQEAFDLFYMAFMVHFQHKKTPFHMIIDAAWARNEQLRQGTVDFLEYIQAAFPKDVWIVTAWQALQWVQDPTPKSNITEFEPWQCSYMHGHKLNH